MAPRETSAASRVGRRRDTFKPQESTPDERRAWAEETRRKLGMPPATEAAIDRALTEPAVPPEPDPKQFVLVGYRPVFPPRVDVEIDLRKPAKSVRKAKKPKKPYVPSPHEPLTKPGGARAMADSMAALLKTRK